MPNSPKEKMRKGKRPRVKKVDTAGGYDLPPNAGRSEHVVRDGFSPPGPELRQIVGLDRLKEPDEES